MHVIEAQALCKSYRVPVKEVGLGGSIKHLFVPRYQNVDAVRDVNLTVSAGETVAYVGPNGAGKSTTIKMLTGILLPTSGMVRVNGLDPYHKRQENTKKMGVVFGQRTQLWWDVPVIESFSLIQAIYEIPAAIYRDNLAYLSEMLGLHEFLHSSARRLSLGQRMRADLAVSFLHDPTVVFLDEPTIGLDIAVRERIREFLGRINRERGVTIVLTSHDLDDIKDVCKRLVIIDHGTILSDGPMNDLLDRFVKTRALHLRLGSGGPALAKTLEKRPGVEVVSFTDTELSLRFDRFALSARDVIAPLLESTELLDFRLDEPDIEAVIRDVYAGSLSLHPPRDAS